jgi:hypothetical protein
MASFVLLDVEQAWSTEFAFIEQEFLRTAIDRTLMIQNRVDAYTMGASVPSAEHAFRMVDG